MTIAFNRPYLTGKEAHYLYQAVYAQHLSGNGKFTKQCHAFFEQRYGFRKCLLTTSCTDALEMSALLADIQPGDEVIMPSFTFVSTANAFVLRGAKIVFADSHADQPNLDETLLESLISPRTKAIVVVHYAGVACHMAPILALAERHNLFVIEDAAQAVDSFYLPQGNSEIEKLEIRNSGAEKTNFPISQFPISNQLPLGGIGHLAAFSFHETNNIQSGEGGMLAVNAPRFVHRSEILWEKGTNRTAFFRGEVDKYGWVDMGSSFLPSEMIAAFLFAQLEHLDEIQRRRLEIWQRYHDGLAPLAAQGHFQLPVIPAYATNNAHMFYLVCPSLDVRSGLIEHLKKVNVNCVFHYQSLHQSPFYHDKHDGRMLPNCDRFSQCLVRLPLFFELTATQQDFVIEQIRAFFGQ